jgi:hypothetical protein
MSGEFRVYPVEGGYQIFWCPSAPMHYADRIPHDDKVYSKRQAAYRRAKQLIEKLEQTREAKEDKAVA